MPTSVVQVQYRDGSPARRTRVVLGFSAGMSKEAYTDDRGVAHVSHSSSGRAEIYVSGRRVGEFHAPGQTAVTI